MKMSRFFPALLALFILACLFGVQGQYTTTQNQTTSSVSSSGVSSVSVNSQYSQYYGVPTEPAPSAHISAPVPFDVNAKTPSNLYFTSQSQAVPYAQYMSSPNAGANSLWIQDATNWTQYVTVPQGATLALIAISPAGGRGYLNEILNGLMYNFDKTFYPSSQLTFYADKTGQHTLYFMINGQPSNKVIIDVTGTSNYEQPLYYTYPNYYPGYDPGYYPRYYRGYSQEVSYNYQYSGNVGQGTSVSSNGITY
jgi:hypothetical protein